MSEVLEPVPNRTTAEWANQERELPADSAIPGKFDCNLTPYVIDILNAASNTDYKMVVACMGAQMSKTEMTLNFIGHTLDDDPRPIIYVGPTKHNIEQYFEPRVRQMFNLCGSLNKKQSISEKHNKTHYKVAGTTLRMGWAGSASSLASAPAACVIVDEYDRKPSNEEGDILKQAKARTRTYPDGITFVISTPTRGHAQTEVDEKSGLEIWQTIDEESDKEIHSPTWRLFLQGTRFEWAVPCLHCDEYFIPKRKHLFFPKDCTPFEALNNAGLTCPHCKEVNKDKTSTRAEMNRRGRFIAPGQTINKKGQIAGQPPESTTVSYFISGLMSPFVSWGERAEAYVQAIDSGDPKEIQGVVNLDFGEIYAEIGETPDHKILLEKREHYKFRELNEQVQVITAGVDVQKDGLYYSIRGWGAHYESWQLESGRIYGETQHQPVWDELTEILQHDFDGLQIRRILVDSGYNPLEKAQQGKEKSIHQVYEYCRNFPGLVFPAKGFATMARSYSITVFDEKKKSRAANARNLKLIKYNSDYMKTWLYARFKFANDQRGAFHLSDDDDGPQDYCQQLASESRHILSNGKVVWKKEGENHYLDCEVLNLTAALSLNVHKLRPITQKKKQQKRKRTTFSRR